MTYKIVYGALAAKTLNRMTEKLRDRIVSKIEAVASDPYAPNMNLKKLRGEPGYRLRVGDWRVIYRLDNGKLILLVVKVGPRGGVYDC